MSLGSHKELYSLHLKPKPLNCRCGDTSAEMFLDSELMCSFGSHVGTNLVQRGNSDGINLSTAVLFKIADW